MQNIIIRPSHNLVHMCFSPIKMSSVPKISDENCSVFHAEGKFTMDTNLFQEPHMLEENNADCLNNNAEKKTEL